MKHTLALFRVDTSKHKQNQKKENRAEYGGLFL